MNYENSLNVRLDAHTFATMAMEFFEEIGVKAGGDGRQEAAKRYAAAAEDMARLTRWLERETKKRKNENLKAAEESIKRVFAGSAEVSKILKEALPDKAMKDVAKRVIKRRAP